MNDKNKQHLAPNKNPAHAPTGNGGKPNQAKPAVFGGEPVETDKPAVAEPARPELTREAKQALFQRVFAAEKAIETATEAVDAATVKRSDAVKALIAGLGNGPWKVGGTLIRARLRGDNAFLARPGDDNVEEI